MRQLGARTRIRMTRYGRQGQSVRCRHGRGRDLGMIEQVIRRLHLRAGSTRHRNTGGGMRRQGRHPPCPLCEPGFRQLDLRELHPPLHARRLHTVDRDNGLRHHTPPLVSYSEKRTQIPFLLFMHHATFIYQIITPFFVYHTTEKIV